MKYKLTNENRTQEFLQELNRHIKHITREDYQTMVETLNIFDRFLYELAKYTNRDADKGFYSFFGKKRSYDSSDYIKLFESMTKKPSYKEWKYVYNKYYDLSKDYLAAIRISMGSALDSRKTKYNEFSHNYDTCKMLGGELLKINRFKGSISKYQAFDMNDILTLDSLTFTEIFFLLIGVNPNIASLKERFSNEQYFDIYNYEYDSLDTTSLEALLYGQSEYHYLERKFDLNNINTKEFLAWAVEEKGFIREVKTDIPVIDLEQMTYTKLNRVYPDWFTTELYNQLVDNDFILKTDKEKYWHFKIKDPVKVNAIAWLASKLAKEFKNIVKNQPNLTAYIYYTGTKFNSVSAEPAQKVKDKITDIIKALKTVQNNQK